MGKLFLAVAAFLSVTSFTFAGEITDTRSCKGSADIIADCFSVQAALTANNGTPTFRLSTKSGRVLNLVGRGELAGEQPMAPENLKTILNKKAKQMLDGGQVICGQFEVCPFSKVRRGSAQEVCIEVAENLRFANTQKHCY